VPNYSIWLLEYARVNEQPVGSFLSGMYNQGSLVAPFCYAVIRGEGHVAIVDVGYDYSGHHKYLADISGCSLWQPPQNVLGKIGLQPEDVDTVFITHAHFDHMGNIPAFPNARFFIQERELNKWLWAWSLPERFGWIKRPVNPQDLCELSRLAGEGRLVLAAGLVENALPGIHLLPAYDTHSFGCQYVLVETACGPRVFVGDNMFSYKNLGEIYQPIGFCQCDASKTLLSLDELLLRVGGERERLIPFHEEAVWSVFPSWKGDDGLHVAEICLAPGEASRVP